MNSFQRSKENVESDKEKTTRNRTTITRKLFRKDSNTEKDKKRGTGKSVF